MLSGKACRYLADCVYYCVYACASADLYNLNLSKKSFIKERRVGLKRTSELNQMNAKPH